MKNILRIGEFSKINSISIRTLRFYDQIDLLHPYYIDPETNYRYYHIKQSSIVDSIQYLRQLDFSLEDIKAILSDKSNPHLHQLIEDRYQGLIREKKALEHRIAEIDAFRSGVLLYTERKTSKELEIEILPKRTIWTFELPKNIYQMNQEEYELYLRYLKQEIFLQNPFYEHFGKVGSLMQAKDFKKQQWISTQFALLHNPYLQSPLVKEVTLAAGSYAVSYCSSFEEEIDRLPYFFKTLVAKQLTPVGPYICEVIHEQPNLLEQERDMFIKMQVAVKKNGCKS
ncbi:MerR family transcriptional regulator [Streptococcus zhangguiae]|uniref:MerR family transcriptional regulator n=1 Tax=Streptococcus zhangguiae TaxID=2664091 RepID=A0A6I4RGZ5_9STRE|nr:helix-turn-helix domain-containing protein [Streptococcus sp. zg-70]MWV55723.1 MerR family transcriptional regulator [Streptococcus sp. zg-70]